MLLNRQMKRNF